jgi:ABC-type nickel/cobalt efflux system permease component RcnA
MPLSRLLDADSSSSRIGLLLLAGLVGAAHAVQPGHGKTLVAAASLDHHLGRGLLLGIVTTCSHVASVLVLAGVLAVTHTTRYTAIHRGIAGGAGFVVACVGFWRLGRSLGGHAHDHAAGVSDHEHRSLLGLGLAGGAVPCWDGILLILLAAALGRLAFGVVLLMAFSVGMAAVLIAVGMVAARLRTAVLKDSEESPWARRLDRISSLLLAGIGLAMLLG